MNLEKSVGPNFSYQFFISRYSAKMIIHASKIRGKYSNPWGISNCTPRCPSEIFSNIKLGFLGKFSEEGINSDPKKAEVVWNLTAPLEDSHIFSLFGMVAYVMRLITCFAAIAASLSDLLQGGRGFFWT